MSIKWYYHRARKITPGTAPVEPQEPVALAAPSNLTATREARLITMNWTPNAPGHNQLVESAENGGAYTSLGVWDDATATRQFVASDAATVVAMRVKALGNGTTTLDSPYASASIEIPVTPKAWISAPYTYDPATNILSVTYSSHVDANPDGLTLKIIRPSTSTGEGIPVNNVFQSGQLSLTASVLHYDLNVIPSGTILRFAVGTGTGYSLSSDATKPTEVTIDTAQFVPDPMAGMLIALDNGIVANAAGNSSPTDDLAAWQALAQRASTEGKSIWFPAPYVSCLHSTWNQTYDNVRIIGGGLFCPNLPDGYDPDNTVAANGGTIIIWSGLNGYMEGVDGRFNNGKTTQRPDGFDRWWRGRDTGAACPILMKVTGAGFGGKLKIRNAGGLGVQMLATTCDIESIEGFNNAYDAWEARGGKGSGEGQLIVVHSITDVYESNHPRACRKSHATTTATVGSDNVIAYHNDVRYGNVTLTNCTMLGESGDGVGSSNTDIRIRKLRYDHLKTTNASEENLTGGTTASVSTCGKIENADVSIGILEAYNSTEKGQGPWFDNSPYLTVDTEVITDSWCFRAAAVKTIIPKFTFKMKSATQSFAHEAVIKTTKAGQVLELGHVKFDSNGFTRSFTTAEVMFDIRNKTSSQLTIRIQSLEAIGNAPYLGRQNSGAVDPVVIQVMSGSLGGFQKGPYVTVIDANGNPL